MNAEPNKGGRPTRSDKAASKSLGSVRVTEAELNEYGHAAELEGLPRTVWIRKVLSSAVKRVQRKHDK